MKPQRYGIALFCGSPTGTPLPARRLATHVRRMSEEIVQRQAKYDASQQEMLQWQEDHGHLTYVGKPNMPMGLTGTGIDDARFWKPKSGSLIDSIVRVWVRRYIAPMSRIWGNLSVAPERGPGTLHR